MMPHVPTLVMETVFVSTVLGLLLLFTWFQDRGMRALLWWGATCLLAACGMALLGLRGTVNDFMSIGVANASLILAAGTMWCGAREFEGLKTKLIWVVAPPLIWLMACRAPLFFDDVKARIYLNAVLLIPFIFSAALTFWRGRGEHLVSRWAVVAVLVMHGVFHLIRIPVTYLIAVPDEAELFRSGYFGLMAVSLLLFMVTFAFTLVALTKERAERRHKIAASIDPLTGLLNRRALFDARARLSAELSEQAKIAALVFDLDRFKQINDRFGHPVGDRVLQLFAAPPRAELRPGDLLGRIGGEEFAAFLPGCDAEQARQVGERVRTRFADTARRAALKDFLPTVSVGFAISHSAHDSDVLIVEADRAVYRAKEAGRNCVRGAEPRSRATPAIAIMAREVEIALATSRPERVHIKQSVAA